MILLCQRKTQLDVLLHSSCELNLSLLYQFGIGKMSLWQLPVKVLCSCALLCVSSPLTSWDCVSLTCRYPPPYPLQTSTSFAVLSLYSDLCQRRLRIRHESYQGCNLQWDLPVHSDRSRLRCSHLGRFFAVQFRTPSAHLSGHPWLFLWEREIDWIPDYPADIVSVLTSSWPTVSRTRD